MRAALSVAVVAAVLALFVMASPLLGVLALLDCLDGRPADGWERIREADVHLATFLGWNSIGGGYHTVSAWCGSAARGPCRFCALVRRLLEWRWPGHTRNECVKEGLKPMEGGA